MRHLRTRWRGAARRKVIPAQERKRRRTTRLSAGGLDLRCRDPDLALAVGPGGVAGRRAQAVLGMGQARLAPAIGAAVGRNSILWLIQGHRVIVATGVDPPLSLAPGAIAQAAHASSALAEAVLMAEAA